MMRKVMSEPSWKLAPFGIVDANQAERFQLAHFSLITFHSSLFHSSLRRLDITTGKDARHIVEHIGGADIAVAIILDQAGLDHIDLFCVS